MNIKNFKVGLLSTNCYIVNNDKEAVVIDPGVRSKREFDEIQNFISDNNLIPKHILITHCHDDHIVGIPFFTEQYGCDIYIGAGEYDNFYNPAVNLSKSLFRKEYIPKQTARKISDNETVVLCGIGFRCIFTPGHTNGSVCYITEDSIFTGDTIFRLSAGRCDLETGNETQLRDSFAKIKEICQKKVLTVYPGHGELSDIGYEIENNEYFREA